MVSPQIPWNNGQAHHTYDKAASPPRRYEVAAQKAYTQINRSKLPNLSALQQENPMEGEANITSFIKNYLLTHGTYTDSPGRIPLGKEPVEHCRPVNQVYHCFPVPSVHGLRPQNPADRLLCPRLLHQQAELMKMEITCTAWQGVMPLTGSVICIGVTNNGQAHHTYDKAASPPKQNAGSILAGFQRENAPLALFPKGFSPVIRAGTKRQEARLLAEVLLHC